MKRSILASALILSCFTCFCQHSNADIRFAEHIEKLYRSKYEKLLNTNCNNGVLFICFQVKNKKAINIRFNKSSSEDLKSFGKEILENLSGKLFNSNETFLLPIAYEFNQGCRSLTPEEMLTAKPKHDFTQDIATLTNFGKIEKSLKVTILTSVILLPRYE